MRFLYGMIKQILLSVREVQDRCYQREARLCSIALLTHCGGGRRSENGSDTRQQVSSHFAFIFVLQGKRC